ALHKLCVLYRTPIHIFLLRTGKKQHDAEDLASGFIVRLLEKNRFEGYKRTDKKFRSFLLKCLRRYVVDKWREDTADKRGHGMDSLDIDLLEIGNWDEIERSADFEFAITVHLQIL